MLKLATLLAVPPEPIDPSCGQEGPLKIAVIDEAHCIGCTLCLDACPVDAIVGANKRMHTVVADACTGCDLCLPPCPVDCIDMVVAPPDLAWTAHRAQDARQRYVSRNQRRAQRARHQPTASLSALDKQAILQDVLSRVKARRASRDQTPV